jgi:hypothetical protein
MSNRQKRERYSLRNRMSRGKVSRSESDKMKAEAVQSQETGEQPAKTEAVRSPEKEA